MSSETFDMYLFAMESGDLYTVRLAAELNRAIDSVADKNVLSEPKIEEPNF